MLVPQDEVEIISEQAEYSIDFCGRDGSLGRKGAVHRHHGFRDPRLSAALGRDLRSVDQTNRGSICHLRREAWVLALA